MSWASELFVPLVIAGLAALPGLIALRSQNNKRNVETDGLASDAWKELLEPYRERVNSLEITVAALRATVESQSIDIAALRRENVMLINGVNLLVSQIRAIGHEPVWYYSKDDGIDDK